MTALTEAYGSDSLKTWQLESPGQSCAAGQCAAFGEGQFDWGFGYSSRAIKTQPFACSPAAATESWYNPCYDDSAYANSASVCAARTLETWDDATIADSETVNFVDTNFYAGPPTQQWNTNWAPIGFGDLELTEPACYPISHIPTRRSQRIIWGSDFVPPVRP